MKAIRIFVLMFLFLSVSNFCFANSDDVNNLILGKTLSDVIYEISEDIIENRSEIISINVSGSSNPFIVSFVSNDYAVINNISCDDANCTLFGQYSSSKNIMYILPESIDEYYNFSILNQTFDKISNTFIHELNHHYKDKIPSFYADMVKALDSDNYNDFNDLNLTGIPLHLQSTVAFPDALSTYSTSARMEEIIVRINAVCFQEKKDYSYYWDMIEIKNYELCNQYQFPVYLDNNLASDLKYFIESYVTDYLNISIYDSSYNSSSTVAKAELEEVTKSTFVLTTILITEIIDFVVENMFQIMIIISIIGMIMSILFIIFGIIKNGTTLNLKR